MYVSLPHLLQPHSDSIQRLSTPINNSARCKLTVIAEATSANSTSVPPEVLMPYDDHFHPSQHSNITARTENKRVGTPFLAVDIKPLEKQVIHLLSIR